MKAEATPFQERSLEAVHQILGFTDYFRFPHVLYFKSIPDLLKRPRLARSRVRLWFACGADLRLLRLPETKFFDVTQAMVRLSDIEVVGGSLHLLGRRLIQGSIQSRCTDADVRHLADIDGAPQCSGIAAKRSPVRSCEPEPLSMPLPCLPQSRSDTTRFVARPCLVSQQHVSAILQDVFLLHWSFAGDFCGAKPFNAGTGHQTKAHDVSILQNLPLFWKSHRLSGSW